jgi:hypothetical protein
MDLVMPEKGENITVKIIGKVEKTKGSDFYCPVRIWAIRGHRFDNIYKMKITKTLWNSLDDELIMREEFGELGGDDIRDGDESGNENPYKIDEDLECIVGKILTISGVPDTSRTFKNKYGIMEPAKMFKTNIREDLEYIEKIGGQEFIDVCEKERKNNDRCISTNFTTINTVLLIKEISEKKTYGIIKTDKKGKKDKGLDDYWDSEFK